MIAYNNCVCAHVCGGVGGSVRKKPAGELGSVSSVLQAPGSTSSIATIRADRVVSNCLEHVLSAVGSLHFCIVICVRHEKGIFPEHVLKLFMAQL